MERVYSRGKYIGEIEEFEKCDEEGRRVWERKIQRRNMKNKIEKRKGDKVKSGSRGV